MPCQLPTQTAPAPTLCGSDGTGMFATNFPLAWSMRVTVPASWLATHSDPPPTARLCGLAPILTDRPAARLVAGSIRTTVPEASSTQRTPSATVTHPAPGKGMTAANRPRSKAGTVTPVPVGVGGGWVDRGVLGVSATSAHAAAASSTATTSVLCQRGARSGDGRSLAGVGMAHLPSQGSRAEHPFLPTPDAPGNSSNGTRPPGSAAGQPGGQEEVRVHAGEHTGRGVVGHRWCGSFSDPRGQFVGAIAFTQGCERNFWSFAQTTWV